MAWKTAAMTAAMLAVAGSAGSAGGDPLSGYRWKSRVLVLAAPDGDDAQLKAQRQALASGRTGASARDLVTVEAVGKGRRPPPCVGISAFRTTLSGRCSSARTAVPS